MNGKLKVLHLEDEPDDAQLVGEVLKKGLIDAEIIVVNNKKDFEKALLKSPDLILSDHSLPSFNSTEAFRIFKRSNLQIPFILITATVSEEFAVSTIKSGVSDYILKDNLIRLPSAIEQALELFKIEKEKQIILNRITDSMVALDNEWRYTFLNDAALAEHPSGREATLGKVIWDVHPEMRGTIFWDKYHEAKSTGMSMDFESFYAPFGFWFSVKVYPSAEGITIFYTNISERKLADEKIRKSEERLIEAQAVAKVGSWETDLLTLKVIWSLETYRIFELDPAHFEVTHTSFLDFVHPEDKEQVDAAFVGSFNHTDINTIEHRIITGNGIEKWVLECWRVFNDGMGKSYRAAGICQDITDRKKIAEKIRLNESRLLKAQEIGRLGYWQIDLENGKVWASKEAMRIYGFPAEEGELEREKIDEYIIELDRVRQAAIDLVEKNKPYNIEFRINKVDGSGIKNIHALAELKRNKFGKPIKIVGTLQDITERKQAEEQLKIEKYFSESLINSLPGIFYLYDQDGRFTRWNRNFEIISGYRAEEISRMHPLDFYDEDEKKLIKRKIEKVFADGDEEIMAHFYTKDKKKIPYYFNGHKISLNGNYYLIGVGIDMSERTRAEQELMAYTHEIKKLTEHLEHVREEERTRIAREIHDELGQQLTGLKMDASWLSKKIGRDEQLLHEKLASMISLMDHTVQTIRRISSDLRPGILDDLGLLAALEWQSTEFEKRTEIRCVFISNIDDIEVDRHLATGVFRIYQEALTNVMRHAKATLVEASLEKTEMDIVLTILDNGHGFDASTTKMKESLGLIGMRERASMLGITLTITSEHRKGTSVILKIPFTLNTTTVES